MHRNERVLHLERYPRRTIEGSLSYNINFETIKQKHVENLRQLKNSNRCNQHL